MEIENSSGNVFADLGLADADVLALKSEIVGLRSEVERTNDVLESQAHVILDLRSKLDAAWNDALKEAARELEGWGDIYGDNAADAIRAIHRPT